MSDGAAARVEWIRTAMDLYQGRLIRFAARITGDVESARDVVQDTFLRLCRQDPEETRGHLAAWLFRVCRNRALDTRKKEVHVVRIDGLQVDALPSGPPEAMATLEKGEQARAVVAAMAELPARQQEVLRLRFQEELSYKEISTVTGHSVTNVGFLIHTALKRLRRTLAEDNAPRRAEGGRSHA